MIRVARIGRRGLITALVVILLLVLLRLALPSLVRGELNQRLQAMGDYSGSVRQVDLALWRGAYEVHDLIIVKNSDEVQVPFVEVPLIELSLSWRHLFRGRIVGDAVFHAPAVNFVDGRTEAETQAGLGVNWRQQLERISPFLLDEVVVHDGTLTLLNFGSNPPIDASLESLQARVTNLGNVQRRGERDLPSSRPQRNCWARQRSKPAACSIPWGATRTSTSNCSSRRSDCPR